MTNFTAVDIFSTLLALLFWAIVSIGPGLVLGYSTNVLAFRTRSLIRQLSLAALLSMTVLPSLYNIICLLAGIKAAVYLNLVFLVAVVGIWVWRTRQCPRSVMRLRQILPVDLAANRWLLIAIAVWIVLSLAMLIDIQIGHGLYLSMTMYDHSQKVGYIDNILLQGIPPTNPTFFPGRALPVLYHYYWTMLGAIVSGGSFGLISNTRHIVLSGIIWTGIVFLQVIWFGSWYFKTLPVSTRRVQMYSLFLLLVGNLYFLLSPLNFIQQFLAGAPLFLSIGWWAKDHIDPLLITMTWVPHHIAALACVLFSGTLLLESERCEEKLRRISLACLSGFCLASTFGFSIYIALTLAVVYVAWFIVSLLQRRYVVNVLMILAAATALLLMIPFFYQYIHFPSGVKGHGLPLYLSMRRFELIDCIFLGLLKAPKFLHQLVYFFMLPLNFLFGFGFTLVGSVLFWNIRRKLASGISSKETFLVCMTVVALILGALVRLRSHSNDFGWRCVMVAQLPFLLWSGQFLAYKFQQAGFLRLSNWNRGLIGIGILSCVYGLFLDRTSVTFLCSADRSYALRSLYEELDRKLPLHAVIQHAPVFISVRFPLEMFGILYSHRRMVVAEKVYDLTGPEMPDLNEYQQVGAQVLSLFQDINQAEALKICQQEKINVILVKDTDPVWSNKKTWVWHYPQVAKNNYAAAFEVRASEDKPGSN